MDQTGSARSRHVIGVLVLALVIAAGTAASLRVAGRVAEGRAAAQLVELLRADGGVLARQVDGVGAVVAGAAANLAGASFHPTALTDQRIQAYVDRLTATEGAIAPPGGMAYIHRSHHRDLAREVFMRRASAPDFTVADGPYRVFAAITWARTADHPDVLGSRLDSHGERSSALAESADRRRLVLSAPYAAEGSGDGRLVDLSAPVLRDGEPQVSGWISTALSVDALLGDRSARLHIEDNGRLVHGTAPPEGSLVQSVEVDVVGRTWKISGWAPAPGHDVPSLLAGLSMTALLAIGVLADRRQRRRHADDVVTRLTQQAMEDHLTGLANRRHMTEALGEALGTDHGDGPHATVLLLDLDRFKEVNDTLGHAIGDRMLIDVATRLREACHAEDLIARMGGDEFVVLCTHALDEPGAAGFAEAVAEGLAPGLVVDDAGVASGVSIGLVRPQPGASVEDVLRQADLAMYDAKAAPADEVRAYRPELGARADQRFAVETALRRALAADEVGVAYQPMVDPVTRAVVAVEALARWSLDGVVQPPATFLPVAESTGLVVDLDAAVLEQACRAAVEGSATALVGVNLSARTVGSPDLVARVQGVLERTGLPPRRLVLELTEHALIAPSASTDRSLEILADMGIELSLDDFGTGYASLAYLRRFPVASVKIDRTFVEHLVDRPEDRAIVAGTIQMAHSLGLRTVAEGVETPAQAHLLIGMGCDLLQGYLLGRPGPFADAVRSADELVDVGGTGSPR